MARLSSSTPHTTEMTKLVRYHAHLHACGAISATPVAKERRQGWGAGTLRRRPTQQRRRQRRGLRSAAGSPQRPARCSSGSGEAARGVSARASAPACSRQRTTPATAVAAALCVASRRGWQSLRRRGLSVDCTQMAKGPPSSEHSAASEEAAGDEEAAAAAIYIYTPNVLTFSLGRGNQYSLNVGKP